MRKSTYQGTGLVRRLRNFLDDRRGTAIFELAFLIPVLLTIGLGVMEFANLIYKRHLIENGIRDAARYIAGQPTCDTTAGANLAMTGTIDGSGAPRVPGWTMPATDITCTVIQDTYNSVTLRSIGGVLQVVRINTNVTYSDIDLGFMGVLDRLGSGVNAGSFPVRHEERYYGTR